MPPILQLPIGGVQIYQLPVGSVTGGYSCGIPGVNNFGLTGARVPNAFCYTQLCGPYSPQPLPQTPYVIDFSATPNGTAHHPNATGGCFKEFLNWWVRTYPSYFLADSVPYPRQAPDFPVAIHSTFLPGSSPNQDQVLTVNPDCLSAPDCLVAAAPSHQVLSPTQTRC